ncbi:hypothetical protein [Anaerotruncus sp. 1XD42-93]|jgi:YbbR domain-containing protein|uniref:CdaR family protein n=1 Tax=Anaerotruncus sp. 1XD42-93 TaxID=2320853 RepID=UPI000EA303F2|nr:hypothetical protein [Anaerotruncus sp. 1XD42-93]MCI9159937.1 hypothetical protein [Anaerotruncus sp.]NBK17158.1 hypothetical protein [Anaerotruncus sp. 1XD42-93]RKJ98139.1 hypothetical protein D7Y41_05500 [Anaerotruncus sp. 1XD22-93]
MKKLDFGQIFQSRRLLMIFSLVMGVLSWMFVVIFVDNEIPWEFKGVPVDVYAEEELLSINSLRIVEDPQAEVTVVVEGGRIVVGGLEEGEIRIVADLEGISTPGDYAVKLKNVLTANQNYVVREIKPSTVNVRVDRITTKRFEVKMDIDGPQVPDGYLNAGTTISPRAVEVTGPEADISRIAQCIVSASFSGRPLTENQTIRSEIKLFDEEGHEIPKDRLTMESDSANVTVQVLKQKRLPLRFEYLNMPSGFPRDDLRFEMTDNSILVAGPEEVVDSYEELQIGYVDLSEVTPGFVQVFDISLPTGFISVENLRSVGVSFSGEGLTEAYFNVSQITPVNVPINYDVTINTTQLFGVRIIGSSEVMETLTAKDIVAEIDFSERELSTGSSSLPVSISVPGRKLAWAVGEYAAVVTIDEK